jgi:hypothetical protein
MRVVALPASAFKWLRSIGAIGRASSRCTRDRSLVNREQISEMRVHQSHVRCQRRGTPALALEIVA